MSGNEDIKETIWEYQVSYTDLYRELGWPCSYSALSWCLSGKTRLTDKRRRKIIDAVDKIYKGQNYG